MRLLDGCILIISRVGGRGEKKEPYSGGREFRFFTEYARRKNYKAAFLMVERYMSRKEALEGLSNPSRTDWFWGKVKFVRLELSVEIMSFCCRAVSVTGYQNKRGWE